jgi:hypothetical protein
LLLDQLEQPGHSEVEVEPDYYWSIPTDKLYAPYEQPTDLTLGQLSSDLEEVRRINSGEKPAVAYGLVWLSALLRFVGAKAVG